MPYPDILELLQQLQTTHEEDRHLYRGQMKRYEPHRWSVQQELREVEALYPADYRFHYQIEDFSRESLDRIVQRVSAARAFGRTVRDQFGLFLFVTLVAEGAGRVGMGTRALPGTRRGGQGREPAPGQSLLPDGVVAGPTLRHCHGTD